MSWNMHVCSVYDIQYEYPGMIGYEAQDALYRIFEMFDVETSAEDIYDEDYEVGRSELVELRFLNSSRMPELAARNSSRYLTG